MIKLVGSKGQNPVSDLPLLEKSILITGAAKRLGRAFALACAQAGADVVIHYGQSEEDAITLRDEITSMGRIALVVEAELNDPAQVSRLLTQSSKIRPLYGLVNSAAIFRSLSMQDTTLDDWERHLAINLTAPFLLSQAFALQARSSEGGRIVNILDWRALRPSADHFPYTVSKAALAAMTKSLAVALAPDICVNGLALGAILPPAKQTAKPGILQNVPAARWGRLEEVAKALIYLLTGPAYMTGEILHVDGGRHLI